MNRYVLGALATVALAGLRATGSAAATLAPATTLAPAAVPSPATRNLLTTEFRNSVPSVTLRGAQLSTVATSILPFESLPYYQTIGGYFLVSVVPVTGTGYDSAACKVTYSQASCTDTTAGSNAAIDILGDPRSNYAGNYRTFKVNYRARDPLANSSIFNPVRSFALSIVFSDNATPRSLVRQYVCWTSQP